MLLPLDRSSFVQRFYKRSGSAGKLSVQIMAIAFSSWFGLAAASSIFLPVSFRRMDHIEEELLRDLKDDKRIEAENDAATEARLVYFSKGL